MEKTIAIQNLKCGGCATTIIKKLKELKGITNVKVIHEISSVLFHTEDEAGVVLVKDTLKVLGYPQVDEKNSIITKAKSFVSCANGRIKNK